MDQSNSETILESVASLIEKSKSIGKIVDTAALIGDSFHLEMLQYLIPIPIRGIRMHLSHLERLGIIHSVLPGEIYRFHSSAVHQALYRRIPESIRRNLHEQLFKKLLIHRKSGRDIELFDLAVHGISARHPHAIHYIKNAIDHEVNRGNDHRAAFLCSLLNSCDWTGFTSDMHQTLGELAQLQGDFPLALQEFQNALTALPEHIADEQKQQLQIKVILLNAESTPALNAFTMLSTFMEATDPESVKVSLFMKCQLLQAESAFSSRFFGRALQMIQPFLSQETPGLDECEDAHLCSIAGRLWLINGNRLEAEKYLKKSLEKKRKSNNRTEIVYGLIDIGWFHAVMGDYQRAYRAIGLGRNILSGITRPAIQFELHKAGYWLFMDEGNLTAAESEIHQIEMIGKSSLTQAHTLWTRVMLTRIYLRKNQKALVNNQLKFFVDNMHHAPVESIREMMGLAADAVDWELEAVNDLLWNGKQKLDDFWECMPKDPLPDVLLYLTHLTVEKPDKLEKLWQDASDWSDPLTSMYFFILDCVGALPESISGKKPVDDIIAALDQPMFREYQSDVFYCWGRSLLLNGETVEKHTSGFQYLIKSRDLASRLDDQRRTIRAQDQIGSRINGKLLHFLKGDHQDAQWAAIEFLLHVKELPEMIPILEDICREITGAQSGELHELGKDSRKLRLRWGERPTMPLQRKMIRELEVAWRSLESIQILDQSLIILLVKAGTEFMGALVLFDFSADPLEMTGLDKRRLEIIGQIIGLTISHLDRESTLIQENTVLRKKLARQTNQYGLIGCSASMRSIEETVQRIRQSRTTVHITGETGVGKELVARAIHRSSGRSEGPFIAYNCSTAPENLVESELFGHVKGAFTGAIQARPGVFTAASGGTLFLDEVADLPMSTQVKLLRTLQERRVKAVGADIDKPVDVRIISATNKDLTMEVKDGRFRQDLYYRLIVLEIVIPPLRERPEDIPLLIDHFLNIFCTQLHQSLPQISPDAMRLLMSYDWPGNVRELQNVLEVAVNLNGTRKIWGPEVFEKCLKDFTKKPPETLAEIIERTERLHIMRVLSYHNGIVTRAAETLGISRQGLFKKIKTIGIEYK